METVASPRYKIRTASPPLFFHTAALRPAPILHRHVPTTAPTGRPRRAGPVILMVETRLLRSLRDSEQAAVQRPQTRGDPSHTAELQTSHSTSETGRPPLALRFPFRAFAVTPSPKGGTNGNGSASRSSGPFRSTTPNAPKASAGSLTRAWQFGENGAGSQRALVKDTYPLTHWCGYPAFRLRTTSEIIQAHSSGATLVMQR